MSEYKANFCFKNENITIDFDEWDCNRDFLGHFIVEGINVPNQSIVLPHAKNEFHVYGVWNKNRTWYDMQGVIDIKIKKEDMDKLIDLMQNDKLTWHDIENMEFISWYVNGEYPVPTTTQPNNKAYVKLKGTGVISNKQLQVLLKLVRD